MEEISQELARRMAAFVKTYAEVRSGFAEDYVSMLLAEARAIVAMLPVPVDPDLIEARTIMALSCEWLDAKAVAAGSHDSDPIQCAAFTGICRGRELAKARAGEGSV